MPGSFAVGSVHYESDRSWRVTLAEYLSNLSVGHYATAGNSTNELVDTRSIVLVWSVRHEDRSLQAAKDRPRWSTVARAPLNLQRQAD
jgi:hypothetical protein